MDLRCPVRSLDAALTQALERDLDGLESADVNRTLRGANGAALKCRPHKGQCDVVLFEQCWRSEELGMDRGRCVGEAIDAETIIVTGPAGDACVYVASQLLYHVVEPNRRFFLDVAAQRMRGRSEHRIYEGRDTEDQEAFDFEVAAALACLRGAAARLSPTDAALVANMLRRCASEFDELVDDPGRCGARHALLPGDNVAEQAQCSALARFKVCERVRDNLRCTGPIELGTDGGSDDARAGT